MAMPSFSIKAIACSVSANRDSTEFSTTAAGFWRAATRSIVEVKYWMSCPVVRQGINTMSATAIAAEIMDSTSAGVSSKMSSARFGQSRFDRIQHNCGGLLAGCDKINRGGQILDVLPGGTAGHPVFDLHD